MPTMTKLPYLNYAVKNKCKPGPLDGLSDKMIDQHWMLYKGYVTNVNLLNKTIWDCLDEDKELNEPRMAEVQRRLGFEYNGMVLHEYYFEALKKDVHAPSTTSKLHTKLTADFGSVERWQKQFTQIGKMRGIGWVITYLDPSSNRLINIWVSDHETGHIAGFLPIVVMDVWEHAYVGDYGPNSDGRQKYIEAFFRNLNWDVIAERHSKSQTATLIHH
jgi:Fe-Mn family superoxide dismutase